MKKKQPIDKPLPKLKPHEYKKLGKKMSLLFKNQDSYTAGLKEIRDLSSDQTKLPYKKEYKEEENKRFDIERLLFIKKCLSFITTYLSSPIPAFIQPSKLNKTELDFIERTVLFNVMELLKFVAATILNFSGEIRGKYKELLSPHPFRWETIEQLAGLMVRQGSGYEFFSLPKSSLEKPPILFFMEEARNIEPIAEAAIPDIIKDDLPELHKLIDYMLAKEQNQPVAELTSVKLEAIKAITRRLYDTTHLQALLTLTNNETANLNKEKFNSKVSKTTQNNEELLEYSINKEKYAVQTNLSSKLLRHAVLRRLQKIGELLTGKNFSSALTKLDDTTDWQALITIRDCISHQDENDNKKKVDELLQNKNLLEQIVTVDMPELYKKILRIIVVRHSKPPFYLEDPNKFWLEIYNEVKKEKLSQTQNAAPVFNWRVSMAEAALFLNAVKTNVTNIIINETRDHPKWRKLFEDSLTLLQLKWLAIFNGRGDIPGARELGELFSFVPSRQVNKELNKKCAEIRDKAINADKLDDQARNAARNQRELASKQREQAREARFTGLINLRKLAKSFLQKPNTYMSKVQRVNAAIEALENIKEFMEQDIFIQGNFNYSNIDEWIKAQPKYAAENFYARLLSSPEFSDAIEYNAGQLLQHLDKLKEYPEAGCCPLLNNRYHLLRMLRNYIEHGNYLYDKREYDPENKEPQLLTRRNTTIGPWMIQLIFELLPDLKQMRIAILNPTLMDEKAIHPAPLVAEKELEEWNKVLTL